MHNELELIALHMTAGDRKHVEHEHWINTTTESIHYIKTHPDVYYSFLKYQQMGENINSIKEKKVI